MLAVILIYHLMKEKQKCYKMFASAKSSHNLHPSLRPPEDWYLQRDKDEPVNQKYIRMHFAEQFVLKITKNRKGTTIPNVIKTGFKILGL